MPSKNIAVFFKRRGNRFLERSILRAGMVSDVNVGGASKIGESDLPRRGKSDDSKKRLPSLNFLEAIPER